ncbi:MAG: MCE family protein [Parvularculaceae bacterium]|nr:MCE family protein [Parvularculaceae bacterium]
METRAHYVLIGAFVLSAIAAAFLFVLWLGQKQDTFDEYDVIFTQRVSGLSKGGQVRFNGIQKGEVHSLAIDPENPTIVRARVRVDRDTPIKTDTRAELELVGFTGLAVISFVGGSRDKPLLKEVVRGVPEITGDTAGLAAFFEGSGDIVAAAQRLLSEDNTKAVTRTLESFAEVSEEVAKNKDEIGVVIRNAATISTDLASTMKKLDRSATQLEKIMASDGPETVKEARALVVEMRAMVAENREPLAAFTNEGLSQVGPAIVEARRLMRSLDQVLREVDRDPRGYIFGDSTPRYEAGERR